MTFGIGGPVIVLALVVLCLAIAWLRHRRRRQPPPVLSFFDVIGRREP